MIMRVTIASGTRMAATIKRTTMTAITITIPTVVRWTEPSPQAPSGVAKKLFIKKIFLGEYVLPGRILFIIDHKIKSFLTPVLSGSSNKGR